jgi:hypothetical protein
MNVVRLLSLFVLLTAVAGSATIVDARVSRHRHVMASSRGLPHVKQQASVPTPWPWIIAERSPAVGVVGPAILLTLIGPPGAAGQNGPRGEKGEKGDKGGLWCKLYVASVMKPLRRS